MHELIRSFETMLEPVFHGFPSLPQKMKVTLVAAWPVLAVVLGIAQLVAAWYLWHLGHDTNAFVDYVNDLAQRYDAAGAVVPRLSVFYWLDLMLLIANAVMLLFAFSGVSARRKEGWELLFLATLAYLLYGVVALFDGAHGGILKFLSVLAVSVIVLYVLYQIRHLYTGRHITHHEKQLPSIKHK